MDEPREREGWRWERLPGGLIRYYPDPVRSASLPHNRTNSANFSAAFWVSAGVAFVVACFMAAIWLS